MMDIEHLMKMTGMGEFHVRSAIQQWMNDNQHVIAGMLVNIHMPGWEEDGNLQELLRHRELHHDIPKIIEERPYTGPYPKSPYDILANIGDTTTFLFRHSVKSPISNLMVVAPVCFSQPTFPDFIAGEWQPIDRYYTIAHAGLIEWYDDSWGYHQETLRMGDFLRGQWYREYTPRE